MRPPLRPLLLGGAALVVGLLAWTAVAGLVAQHRLAAARTTLQQAREDPGSPLLLPRLRAAEHDLGTATALLTGWTGAGPALVARLPVAGRSVEAGRRASAASHAVVATAVDALTVLDGRDLVVGKGLDLAAVRDVGRVLDRHTAEVDRSVARLSRADLGLLPRPVARAVREAQDALDPVPQALARASAAARVLPPALGADRDRKVLIVLENNAELRGTGGVITVFAEATARAGRLDIGPFRDVEDVADDADRARRVLASPDYRTLWGPFKGDTTLWKNTGMSPVGPQSSAVLAGVAAATLGRRPDVVVWLDVRTIAAVLEATGPATLPDRSVLTADNAGRVLMSEAYLKAPDTIAGQRQRRAVLRGAADAVVDRLLSPSDDGGGAAALVSSVGRAAAGRHLLLWTSDVQEQRDLATAGLDGDVVAADGDLACVTFQNLGGGQNEGNKLDYYARRQVTVRAALQPGRAVVEQEVTIRNTAPRTGLPAYVAGLDAPGTSNGFVTLALPRSAEVLGFARDGRTVRTSVLDEADHRVLTDVVALAPGTSATWLLRYSLPLRDGRYRLRVVPQPLAVDAGLSVSVTGAAGSLVTGDDAWSGPLTGTVDVVARTTPADERGLGSRLQRFWREPVRLP